MATAVTSGMAPLLSLRSGQNGRLTFTGTAGPHSLFVGVPTTTRAGKAVGVTMNKCQRQHGGVPATTARQAELASSGRSVRMSAARWYIVATVR